MREAYSKEWPGSDAALTAEPFLVTCDGRLTRASPPRLPVSTQQDP